MEIYQLWAISGPLVISGVLSVALGLQGTSFGFPVPEPSGTASLTFTKFLKDSEPEYLAVSVDSTGAGTYEGRKASDPADPHPFKLSPATTHQLFELASRLRNFQSIDLESHKKVANLGLKTFVYEGGGQTNRTEFNYTLRPEAQELSDLFGRIANVEQHIIFLEYAIKYDPLSLPKELLQIQIDLDNRALADPELMVPSLQQVVKNSRLLHLAQVRAQDILGRLQATN